MKSDAGLVVEDLAVSYARWGQRIPALDGLSLFVPQGQWLMVVGPNGSGKSTLLRAIGRRIDVEHGQIWSDGRDLLALSPADISDSVYYVHQDPASGTAGSLTVLENLLVAEPRKKEHRRERKARLEARQSSAATELTTFIERKIPYFEMLNDEALELIEHNAETVLEQL